MEVSLGASSRVSAASPCFSVPVVIQLYTAGTVRKVQTLYSKAHSVVAILFQQTQNRADKKKESNSYKSIAEQLLVLSHSQKAGTKARKCSFLISIGYSFLADFNHKNLMRNDRYSKFCCLEIDEYSNQKRTPFTEQYYVTITRRKTALFSQTLLLPRPPPAPPPPQA